ncbi:tetratricopeptide repeat protein [Escherichia coli]|nr:tetratricopeptide repeat protein [Escherichia coli]
MLELLFLLLPVAAAYGWYMGRRSAQQNKQDEANRLSRDYVAGVNFLLSNQQDKAVDLFLDMLKEDTGTVEATLRSETCSVRVAKLIALFASIRP